MSLQDIYAPNSVCFGCGPRNPNGLRIKSMPEGKEVVSDWTPGPDHRAFDGFVSGGILSTLLDCHGNWAATYALMTERALQKPPGTVTAELSIKFLRPTPMVGLRLRAWATRIDGDRVTAAGEIVAGGRPTASMTGLFVAVKEGHPAFHRWE